MYLPAYVKHQSSASRNFVTLCHLVTSPPSRRDALHASPSSYLTWFNQGAAVLRRMQCVSTLGTDSLRGSSLTPAPLPEGEGFFKPSTPLPSRRDALHASPSSYLTWFNQGAAALRRMQCVSTLGTDSLRGSSLTPAPLPEGESFFKPSTPLPSRRDALHASPSSFSTLGSARGRQR